MCSDVLSLEEFLECLARCAVQGYGNVGWKDIYRTDEERVRALLTERMKLGDRVKLRFRLQRTKSFKIGNIT